MALKCSDHKVMPSTLDGLLRKGGAAFFSTGVRGKPSKWKGSLPVDFHWLGSVFVEFFFVSAGLGEKAGRRWWWK